MELWFCPDMPMRCPHRGPWKRTELVKNRDPQDAMGTPLTQDRGKLSSSCQPVLVLLRVTAALPEGSPEQCSAAASLPAHSLASSSAPTHHSLDSPGPFHPSSGWASPTPTELGPPTGLWEIPRAALLSDPFSTTAEPAGVFRLDSRLTAKVSASFTDETPRAR